MTKPTVSKNRRKPVGITSSRGIRTNYLDTELNYDNNDNYISVYKIINKY